VRIGSIGCGGGVWPLRKRGPKGWRQFANGVINLSPQIFIAFAQILD
jgi:hypothetical protein